jgi:RING finger protein 113A
MSNEGQDSAAPIADEAPSSGVTFKKRQRSKNVRQKDDEPEADVGDVADDDTAAAIKRAKAKTSKSDLNLHTTERPKEEFKPFMHESSRTAISSLNLQSNAVAENPLDMVFDDKKNADGESVLAGDEALAAQESSGYAGLASYKTKIDHGREKMKMGPSKLPANVRISCRFDYQPDICKDYKETGYCGYGDACKFLHDRGDYKSGWQLEKEWDASQERERKMLLGQEVEAEENYEIGKADEFPFACFICRGDFVDPVVTKCNHYFCQKCALKNFAKSSKCYVCKEATQGIFNTADKLIKHLAAQHSKAEVAPPAEIDSVTIAASESKKSGSGWMIP